MAKKKPEKLIGRQVASFKNLIRSQNPDATNEQLAEKTNEAAKERYTNTFTADSFSNATKTKGSRRRKTVVINNDNGSDTDATTILSKLSKINEYLNELSCMTPFLEVGASHAIMKMQSGLLDLYGRVRQ